MTSPTDAPSLAELRLRLLNYRDVAPLLIEMNEIEANIKREKYLALVNSGFTEQQALELCK